MRTDRLWERFVLGRSKLSVVMGCIGAHKDEGVWGSGSPRDATNVPNAMAWGINQVERSITKEVYAFEWTYRYRLGRKVQLPDLMVSAENELHADLEEIETYS